VKSLLRVLSCVRPYRLRAVTTLLCGMATTALELVPPWLIKIVIDDVIQARRLALLPWVILGLVVAYGLKNVFASLRIRFNNTLDQRVVHDMRDQVIADLQG